LPLAVSQGVSVLAVVVTAVVMRKPFVPRGPEPWRALVMGPLGALATAAFLYATHLGLLSIVSVIAALYPASTVVLAMIVLRERIHSWQAIGLVFATASVTLVALG
jgi:drug/metabolite transporter (DMT)-like permease